VVPSVRVFLAAGNPGTYLLSDRVAAIDPVPAAGNRGAWGIGIRNGDHFSAGPGRTRHRLARQVLKLADDKVVQIEPTASEVVACSFYHYKLCSCGNHVQSGAHVFD
jgi:hypothetical protein